MIKAYLMGFLAFFIIDTIWIRLVVVNLYIKQVPKILSLSSKGLDARITPAILFYLIFYSCLFYFTATKVQTTKDSLSIGAFLGLMTYSTYSLTNHTIWKQWNWLISISDILWGMTLCSIVSFVIFYFLKK